MSPKLLDAASAELDAECAALFSAPNWARQRALNEAAYSIGQLVGAGLLKQAVAARQLKAAARGAGYHADYGAEHVDRIISESLAAGIARPVEILDTPLQVPVTPRGSRWTVPRGVSPPVRRPEPVEAQRPAKATRKPVPPAEPSDPLTGRQRKRCGARARTRGGAPCQCKVVPGRTRCKLHGGMSTGPKTQEGRARTTEGARRYHAERRAAREVSHQVAMTP